MLFKIGFVVLCAGLGCYFAGFKAFRQRLARPAYFWGALAKVLVWLAGLLFLLGLLQLFGDTTPVE